MSTLTTTPDLQWLAATAEIRQEIFEREYEKALAEIEAGRKGKVKKDSVITATQRRQAENIARSVVVETLYRMESYNGVRNPVWDDAEWSPVREDAPEAPAHKPNRYAGKCVKCDGWVEAEAGKLGERIGGRWTVEHVECPNVEAPAPDGIDLTDLPDGYYAVPGGKTRLKVKVTHGKPGSKWEGWTFVTDGAAYGQQTRYGLQRPGQVYRGQIEDALRAIVADPMEAMQAYGRLVGRCGRCNRILENEASVAAGIGPECASMF